MKLKIIQAGWAGFTGNLCGIDFVDGVSVQDPTPYIAQHIAALIQVEEVDTGKNPSVAQTILDSKDTAMDASAEIPNTTGNKVVEVIHGSDGSPYTRAELEAIASEKGINGLREIGDEHNIKSTKIVDMIEKIIKAGIVNPASIKPLGGNDETVERGGKDGVGELAASAVQEATVEQEVNKDATPVEE